MLGMADLAGDIAWSGMVACSGWEWEQSLPQKLTTIVMSCSDFTDSLGID